MRIRLARFLSASLTLGLCASMASAQGPVFLTGHDPDFHAQSSAGARNLLNAGLRFVTDGHYNQNDGTKFLWVESRISAPGGHLVGENGLVAIGLVRGTHYDRANATELPAVNFADYTAIVIASSFGGLLTRAELDALIARSDDIRDYINGGGGLMALAECSPCGANLLGGVTPPDLYGFLPVDVSSIPPSPPFTITAFGAAPPFNLTNGDINDPTHNSFGLTGGLEAIDRDQASQATTLAGEVFVGSVLTRISLLPESASNPVASLHELTAHVFDSLGNPVPDLDVTFEILSGPHSGTTGMDTTDAGGDARFSYSGSMAGTDTLQASFVNSTGMIVVSNPAMAEWIGQACMTLNFETDEDMTTLLVNGQHIDSEFGNMVTLSSSGPNAGLAVFDSTIGGPNDPSQDPDLLVGTGNVLILQTENLPPDGSDVFPRPNDDSDGGTVTFSFASLVNPRSVRLIDMDMAGSGSVTLTDEAGRQRTFTVPANWTGDRTLAQPAEGTLDLTTLANQPGFGASVMASEDAGFDPEAVNRLDIHLDGSGGIDDLSWCAPGTMLPRGATAVRNGSGVNPMTLAAITAPLVGGTWGLSLDCGSHAPGLGLLVFRSAATDGSMTPHGELLVGGGLLLRRVVPHGGTVLWLMQDVPGDASLCGLEAHVQGLCAGAPGARLSNALDAILGF